MVNPGAFQGTRRDFLLSQKTGYMAGVVGGYAADALADIQRRYFKRYPLDLAHGEEPTAEWLSMVDDDAPDAEKAEPDISTLDEDQYAAAMKQLEERKVILTFRKAVRVNLCRCHLFAYLLSELSKSNVGLHINT